MRRCIWPQEIERLLAPNGIFIATLHGDYHRVLEGRNIDMEQGYRFVDSKRKWFKPDGLPKLYQDAQHTTYSNAGHNTFGSWITLSEVSPITTMPSY